MIDITKLSRQYEVRTLGDSDIDAILDLYKDNQLFYQNRSAPAQWMSTYRS